MATANQAATLIALSALLDQFNDRSHLSLLFNGVQGIGKSEAIYLASEKINGKYSYTHCDTIDGQTLSEGELPGAPYKKKTGRVFINVANYIEEYKVASEKLRESLSDNQINQEDFNIMIGEIAKSLLSANTTQDEELDYAKYPTISKVQKLQEHYYNLAKTEGFKLPSGLFKIDSNGDEVIFTNNQKIIVKEYDEAEHIADGYKNRYAFGSNLSPEDRIHLLITGQIKIFFILIDELNRPDDRTMSEMMNLFLNRRINGYNIPWWVSMSGAQNPAGSNSDYATKELEPAQLDRLCFIEMYGNMDDWAILSLNNGLPEEYVYSVINNGNKCFSPADHVNREEPNIKPSPRSNTIAGMIIKNFNQIISLPCFNDDDRANSDLYLNIILRGLLGSEATNLILLSMEDKENMITIPEILTGTTRKLNETVVNKITNKTIIAQKMLVVSLIQWLCNNWLMVKAKKESADPNEQKQYVNYYHQLAEFIGLLDPAIMNYFCDLVNTKHYDIRLADGTVKPNSLLLRYIYEIVSINPEIRESYTRIKTSSID